MAKTKGRRPAPKKKAAPDTSDIPEASAEWFESAKIETPWPASKPEVRRLDELKPHPKNARTHSAAQIAQLAAGIREFGFTIPLLIDEEDFILAGHGRQLAGEAVGMIYAPVIVARGWSEEQKRAYIIADNQLALNAGWDIEALKVELSDLSGLGVDLDAIGFGAEQLAELNKSAGGQGSGVASASLADRFGVAPFSVLNAREGWWQARKAAWMALGIQSEIGRGDNLLKMSETVLAASPGSGTSIFDPVLSELAYRWFCPPGGDVVDPFAGGSVRGIVAAKLGRRYFGLDLRGEQIEANERQAQAILRKGDGECFWVKGDAAEALPAISAGCDFIFTCPPYGDLERYSDDPRDLSTMDYPAFRAALAKIIAAGAKLLRPDSFACIVVGDFRDKKGCYRGFPSHVIAAFEATGLRLYNEAILVTAAGSLPIRAGKGFESSRKLGKTHQNVLVFLKGDAKRATERIGGVEFGDLGTGEEEREKLSAASLGGQVDAA